MKTWETEGRKTCVSPTKQITNITQEVNTELLSRSSIFDQIYCIIAIIKSHFTSVAQSCPTLCDPMNRSTPGLPVHHQLPEFTQTHVRWVGDAIQPSHPLSSPSPALNLSQHQGPFNLLNTTFFNLGVRLIKVWMVWPKINQSLNGLAKVFSKKFLKFFLFVKRILCAFTK